MYNINTNIKIANTKFLILQTSIVSNNNFFTLQLYKYNKFLSYLKYIYILTYT